MQTCTDPRPAGGEAAGRLGPTRPTCPTDAGGTPNDRRPRALGADPRRLVRDGRGDCSRARQGRLQHRRDPPRFPGGPRSRRGGQGRDRGRRRPGPLHQHERGRRREAGRGAGHAPRAVRRLRGGRSPSLRARRDALARVRVARAVHQRRPQGRCRPQEDGDDPGRDGEQPRLLGPGPLPRRLPRERLEDLRDDLRGVVTGRALVRRRVVGQGRARIAHPAARDGARPDAARGSPPTPSGPA